MAETKSGNVKFALTKWKMLTSVHGTLDKKNLKYFYNYLGSCRDKTMSIYAFLSKTPVALVNKPN